MAINQEQTPDRERRLALFIDFDNLALGMKQSELKQFDIHLTLDRLLEKGRILFKRAYADWARYRDAKSDLHAAAIELIEIPKKRMTGKNAADIRMVVDALDMAYTKDYIDTFVLMTGDSDFSPLVSKLRELNRHVIAIGIKAASSPLLIENCDEFIFYEDILRVVQRAEEEAPPLALEVPVKRREAYDLIATVVRGLFREGRELVWASMVKQTVKRKRPTFDESYYDYSSFSEMLLDMEQQKLLKLERDEKSGSLRVTAVATVRRKKAAPSASG